MGFKIKNCKTGNTFKIYLNFFKIIFFQFTLYTLLY